MRLGMLALLTLVAALAPCTARAGVTIHYEGVLKSKQEAANVVAEASAFAKARGWTIEERKGGIVLRPHSWCEPVELVFDGRSLASSWVKTQFAGPETHIAVVELFRSLRKRFERLTIEDEGEYWEGSDREKLIERMQSDGLVMVRAAQQNPGSKGPYVLPSGRIVDIVNPPMAYGATAMTAMVAQLDELGAKLLAAPFVPARPWRPHARQLARVQADRWSRFEAKEERFTVSLPAPPQRLAKKGEAWFISKSGEAVFAVVAQSPVMGEDSAQTLADIPAVIAQTFVGRILADRSDTLEGAPIRTITVLMGDGVLNQRIVIVGNRP